MSNMVDNLGVPFSLLPIGNLALSSGTTFCAGCLLSASRQPLGAGLSVRDLGRDDALAIDSKGRLFE